MQKVIIASTNPVKIAAVRLGFQQMFPEQSFDFTGLRCAPISISEQPMSDLQTLQGATERCQCAAKNRPDADYWVGVEGGVSDVSGEMNAFAWVVIKSREQVGKARTAEFALPPSVANLVRQGKELGEADDLVFAKENSKQDNGAVGLLTGNVIDRTALYQQAVVLALIPFKNPHLYSAASL
jgi:inosine/xanthosine triphosphatase